MQGRPRKLFLKDSTPETHLSGLPGATFRRRVFNPVTLTGRLPHRKQVKRNFCAVQTCIFIQVAFDGRKRLQRNRGPQKVEATFVKSVTTVK